MTKLLTNCRPNFVAELILADQKVLVNWTIGYVHITL